MSKNFEKNAEDQSLFLVHTVTDDDGCRKGDRADTSPFRASILFTCDKFSAPMDIGNRRYNVLSSNIPVSDQVQAHHRYYYFAFLIYHLTKGVQHTSIRFATRRFHFMHCNTQNKFITGPHRF